MKEYSCHFCGNDSIKHCYDNVYECQVCDYETTEENLKNYEKNRVIKY